MIQEQQFKVLNFAIEGLTNNKNLAVSEEEIIN